MFDFRPKHYGFQIWNITTILLILLLPGVYVDEEEDEEREVVTPVFQTQVYKLWALYQSMSAWFRRTC